MKNFDWNMLSAIGTVSAAVATFIAVFVALWQTKFTNYKKLKLSFGDAYTVLDGSGNKSGSYICLAVTNIGNRKVIINNWGYKLKSGTTCIITSSGIEMNDRFGSYELDIEKQLNLYYLKVTSKNLV